MSFDRPMGREVTGRSKPVYDERGLGPWEGRIKVTPVVTLATEETSIEVHLEWTGPPAAGSPPSDEPVKVAEQYHTDDLTLALAIADWAATDLRGGRVPELDDIAEQLGARPK